MYLEAIEFVERQREDALALGRIRHARLLAHNLCELIEQSDFAEAFLLSVPLALSDDE